MPTGDFGLKTLATLGPASQRAHVGLGPSLVDEHQARGINQALAGDPLPAAARNIGAILFGRDQRLFL